MNDRRVCSGCGSDENVEWELALVYRHDRALTDGSRVVDARRQISPEYLCNACLALVRRGLVPQGRLL